MKTIWTAVFLFLALSFTSAHSIDLSLSQASFLKVLSFDEVKNLSKESRHNYVQSIAKVLTVLSVNTPKAKTYTYFEQLFSLGTIAYAAPSYLCVGGGVPVDSKEKSCGVQSYAGFSCSAGEKICNPMVFGVNNSGSPVCHASATTKWCFENTKLGTTQTLDPVFKANKVADWNNLRSHIEKACSDPFAIEEKQSAVIEACDYLRQQMQVNEDVRKLMAKDYTYKTSVEGSPLTYCTERCRLPVVNNSNFKDLINLSVTSPIRFYQRNRAFNSNSKEASIRGLKGQLLSPMPGCYANGKDHYHFRGDGHFHGAQDLTGPLKSRVQSVASGVVVSSISGCGKGSCGYGYGNSIVVKHEMANGEIFYSSYNHLASVNLKQGDKVAAGSSIGTMGNSGYSSGPHLHFEIMDKNLSRSNPSAYYPQGICSPNSGPQTHLAGL